MGRHHGRITKEDIREAGFRRWDGRQRITTDWLDVFQDPELYWPNGDCLVYLREPGQSSRGPAFRIHTSRLRTKGFECLLNKCVDSQILHVSARCALNNCYSCGWTPKIKELYLPAPPQPGLEATFDHLINTRNFFAWLYNIPQAGRTLGQSLIALSERLNSYRPAERERNQAEIIAYAESQKYLDFRECVDHALAILSFAEYLEEEGLWLDAFAHCVGLSHRGLHESLEYDCVSVQSKSLINEARVEMDLKVDRVNESIITFFENELSSRHWGLHHNARDHLDRFRSFLHSYYIKQHGFWPPIKFNDETTRRLICNSMYSDFRSLFYHLADTKSSNSETAPDISNSGGVCVLQNIHAFDSRLGNEPLPQPLPQLPREDTVDISRPRNDRRNSWNPLVKRRIGKEERIARRMQAMVDSTDRDWNLMSCSLVRRFSEFEASAAADEVDVISLADGRKVRWIAIYAVLQILISVMQAPKQVRNTEGLAYPLCCRVPDQLPWQVIAFAQPDVGSKVELQPDTSYSHTNVEPARPTLSRRNSGLKEKHEATDTSPTRRTVNRTSSALRSTSLRRLISLRTDTVSGDVLRKRASFCEIYVPGYGNGLNEVEIEMMTSPVDDTVPYLSGSNSVSRESSNASSNSSWSKTSNDSGSTTKTPEMSSSEITQAMADLGLMVSKPNSPRDSLVGAIQIVPGEEEGLETVYFNTTTWDAVLRRR